MRWKRLVEDEMSRNGESWDDLQETAYGVPDVLDREVGSCHGDFTVWTRLRVYFAAPSQYSGLPKVYSVPRNPASESSWIGGV